MDQTTKKRILKRIIDARIALMKKYPFYTRLLLKLNIGLARCQTAFTDMKRIVFDPEFVQRLSDDELRFIFHHELLHCVLEHCIRGKEYDQRIYNIACDIVVNSNILYSENLPKFVVDGEEVMRSVPNGNPGYLYTAEEVYRMLLKEYDLTSEEEERDYGDQLDLHPWKTIDSHSMIADNWKADVKDMCNTLSDAFPPAVRQIAEDYHYQKRILWKAELRKFVSRFENNFDYNYRPPDRRFYSQDIFIPGFNSVEGEHTENIWFLIDTSASILNNQLKAAYAELESAIAQVPGLDGMLSFFDTRVTEPRKFHKVKELYTIEPTGGGGTSFRAIFKFLTSYESFKRTPPAAIIIFTDGYAEFPEKASACGIPVLWILVNSYGDEIKPPWGKCIRIKDC